MCVQINSMNNIHILKIALASAVLGLLCLNSGCQKSQTPSQAQVIKVVELGSKLNSATEAGLSYSEFRSSVLEFVGALDLAIEMWPKDLPASAKQQMLNSKEVWLFTKNFWEDKVDKEARFKNLKLKGLSGTRAELMVRRLPEKARTALSFSDGDYMGREKTEGGDAKHLSYDKIGDALRLASSDFVLARAAIAEYLSR